MAEKPLGENIEGLSASEGEKPEGEDPKEIARTMLIDMVDVEQIAQETGLKKRTIWALKGALARAGKIPTKKELEKESIVGARRGEEVPFRREKSAPELIYEICEKYGVKGRARHIIVDRCKRVPGGVLHPGDLERLLTRLDTGLKRDESGLIAEEYELALQGLRTEEGGGRRGYYVGRGESERGGRYYEEEGYTSRYEPRYEVSYDHYGRRLEMRPEVSRRDLEDLKRDFADLIRGKREEDRIDKILDVMTSHSEDITTLATELRNLKENPPVPPSSGEDPYLKALELQLDVARENAKSTREDAKVQAKELRELIREERKEHKVDIEKLGEKVESAKRDARTLEGIKDENVQLAVTTIREAADVLKTRKPVEEIIRGISEISKGAEKAPEREKLGETKVEIPSEYLE